MIHELDNKPCIECGKMLDFQGSAKAMTGRADRNPYQRGWWRCKETECKEYLNAQIFYVGEHKHGERAP